MDLEQSRTFIGRSESFIKDNEFSIINIQDSKFL